MTIIKSYMQFPFVNNMCFLSRFYYFHIYARCGVETLDSFFMIKYGLTRQHSIICILLLLLLLLLYINYTHTHTYRNDEIECMYVVFWQDSAFYLFFILSFALFHNTYMLFFYNMLKSMLCNTYFWLWSLMYLHSDSCCDI